jgi:hypothetical protein
MIKTNLNRFDRLWPNVESTFIGGIETDEIVLRAFLEFVPQVFNGQTDKMLCGTFGKLLKSREVKWKVELLETIGSILSLSDRAVSQGFPFLLEGLDVENFSDQGELSGAFRCVQLIANDLILALSYDNQIGVLRLILKFGGQTTDINVSLSSFGLLWNMVSVFNTAEMWKLLFDGLRRLIDHPHADISLSAVNTFFSLIVSTAQSIPDEIFAYLAGELFIPIIQGLVKQHAPTQQLAFHQLAHCGRNLWSKFASVSVFPVDMWDLLLDAHETFFKNCEKRETKMAAFQFYEEVFQCANFTEDLSCKCFDSLTRLTDFMVSTESANSSLLGALGRLIRIVLPAQKPRMTSDMLRRWIVIIEKTVFDVNCGDFLPPTSHKAMDAFSLILPLDVDLTKQIYSCLVRIACNSMHNTRLTGVALDHITEICENKIPVDFIPQLFVMSGSLFTLDGARKLLLFFVEKDIPISDDRVDEVSRSLMDLGKSNVELKDKTAGVILRLFPRVAREERLDFVTCYGDSFESVSSLLKRYCDIESGEFSQEISDLCCREAIRSIACILPKCGSEEKLSGVLAFVCRLNTRIGEECAKYHLFLLLPVLADLVLHPSTVVRKKLRKILLAIGESK